VWCCRRNAHQKMLLNPAALTQELPTILRIKTRLGGVRSTLVKVGAAAGFCWLMALMLLLLLVLMVLFEMDVAAQNSLKGEGLAEMLLRYCLANTTD
jgi:hypothetical protein